MELLAPAGNWAALEAAFASGADAVYLGGHHFNARQSADNFSPAEIQKAVEYARLRNKKVYAACNVLISNKEFAAVLDYLHSLYLSGVDAVIVQDLGLLKVMKDLLPEWPVHASTQMTVHNSEAAAWLGEQGISRIVLARELSLAEITRVQRDNPEMEFEVFVHGALCYCYSGQCLFSSMVGGRSGNRGRCAQPCRLPYTLLADDGRGKKPIAAGGRFLLSPADLCLIEHLAELKEAGVTALKIEGRMKRAEYVAVVTSVYREALDLLPSVPDTAILEGLKKKLCQVFNRNLSKAYFTPGEKVLSIQRPNNRGVYLGRIISLGGGSAAVKLSGGLNLGDVLEVWVGHGKGPRTIVNAIEADGEAVSCAESGQVASIPLAGRAGLGDRVFKIHDEELMQAVREKISAAREFRVPINMCVKLEEGRPLRLIVEDAEGHKAEVFGKTRAVAANDKPLDEEVILEKLSRLGGTPFVLSAYRLEYAGNLILPYSDLNDCRRRAVEQLLALICRRPEPERCGTLKFEPAAAGRPVSSAGRRAAWPLLSVAVGSADAARKVVAAGADRVYIALQGFRGEPHTTAEALVELCRWGKQQGALIVPVLPRIQKPGEKGARPALDNALTPVLLAGNLGALRWAQQHGFSCRIDYSLNCFNQYTLDWLLTCRVDGVCLSPELNLGQLQGFRDLSSAELLVHGDLPLMVSQSCPIKAVQEQDGHSCSQACQEGRYWLRDDKGYEFPVATDLHCRFYVFNSRRLCLLDELERLWPLGCESLRIEAWRQNPDEAAETVAAYRRALQALIRGRKIDLALLRQVLQQKQGFSPTKGHLYRGVE